MAHRHQIKQGDFMKYLKKSLLASILFLTAQTAFATVVVDVYSTANHTLLGTITATDTPKGLKLTPDLHGLPPGNHGFHIHNNSSCGDHGMAAGDHFDPKHSGKHAGPYATNGHTGDLPKLYVAKNGTATKAVIAPHLTEKEIMGHSFMIHAGSDNYSDSPKPNGNGGARIACAVISK